MNILDTLLNFYSPPIIIYYIYYYNKYYTQNTQTNISD
jgi:hypothetical protein